MRIKTVEPLVKDILEKYEETRGDNFELICRVYYVICKGIIDVPFSTIMLNHKELGLPSFESITRARRKIQAEHEELRPEKEIQEIRDKEEEEYKEYSRSR